MDLFCILIILQDFEHKYSQIWQPFDWIILLTEAVWASDSNITKVQEMLLRQVHWQILPLRRRCLTFFKILKWWVYQVFSDGLRVTEHWLCPLTEDLGQDHLPNACAAAVCRIAKPVAFSTKLSLSTFQAAKISPLTHQLIVSSQINPQSSLQGRHSLFSCLNFGSMEHLHRYEDDQKEHFLWRRTGIWARSSFPLQGHGCLTCVTSSTPPPTIVQALMVHNHFSQLRILQNDLMLLIC